MQELEQAHAREGQPPPQASPPAQQQNDGDSGRDAPAARERRLPQQPDTDALDALLRSLGHRRYPVPGDGSCMFSALAHQLYG